MAKATFKNTAEGARGVRDPKGQLYMIEPGRQLTMEVSDVELSDARKGGHFSIDEREDADEAPLALSAMNKADLLATAAKEGADVEEGATKADIIAAIEAKREAQA